MTARAVRSDRRGALVTGLDNRQWAAEALRRLGREDDVAGPATARRSVQGRLDAPGMDAAAARHPGG